MILGVGGYWVFLTRAGGLAFLLSNLEIRTSIQAGNNYFVALTALLPVAVAILIYSNRFGSSQMRSIAVVCLVVVSTGILLTLGGRKPAIALFATVLFVKHYGVSRMRRLKPLHLLLVAAIGVFFVLNPVLREPGGLERAVADPSSIVASAAGNAGAIVADISPVPIYIFVTSEFGPSNIWLGESYLDLAYAPVPSGIFPEKPPVDDGVYIRSIVAGIEAEPGSPFSELFPSSLPPETLGASYMNFWLPGVIAGMYILGVLRTAAFTYMRSSGESLLSILIYSHVVLSFELSNLRIVQFLTFLVMTALFFRIFFGGVSTAAHSNRSRRDQMLLRR